MKYKNSKDTQELEENIGVQAWASTHSSDQTWTRTHDGDHHSASCFLLGPQGRIPSRLLSSAYRCPFSCHLPDPVYQPVSTFLVLIRISHIGLGPNDLILT